MNVEIKVLHEERLDNAIKLINRLVKYNAFDLHLEIILDYKLADMGCYYLDRPYKIFINPDECTESNRLGFTDDPSVFGVAIHEFCHFLHHIRVKNILRLYKCEFPEPFIINDNCLINREEELIEIMSLYITNPYLLNHINFKCHAFFKSQFNSPSPLSTSHFVKCYQTWNAKLQRRCRTKWKLGVTKRSKKVYVV